MIALRQNVDVPHHPSFPKVPRRPSAERSPFVVAGEYYQSANHCRG
jgi:hypothetical protein